MKRSTQHSGAAPRGDLSQVLHAPWAINDSAEEECVLPLPQSSATRTTSNQHTYTSTIADDSPSKEISPSGSSNLDSPDMAVFGLAPLEGQPPATGQPDGTANLHDPRNEYEDGLDDEPLPEMMYVTDELGNILTLKDPGTWNKWLAKNCPTVPKERIGKSLCPWLVGRNLFEYIEDEKVAAFTRHIIYMLGTGQQDSFKYFWFCDTPTLERKMLMNVTAHQAFDDSKLVVWASRIIYEKALIVPQNWLLQEVIVKGNCATTAPVDSSSPMVETGSSSSAPQPTNTGSSSSNTALSSSQPMQPQSQPQTCLPNRNVCSYCKRIMVVCDDLDPAVVQAIADSSNTLPASVIYEGPVPLIGARGRNGLQPATDDFPPTTSESSTTPQTAPPRAQLSVQGVVNHLWLSPHQYYNVAKLDDNVTIFNGVCEVCYAEIGFLFFKKGTFANGVRIIEESIVEKRRLEVAEKAVEKEKMAVGTRGIKRSAVTGMGAEEKKIRPLAPKPTIPAVPMTVNLGGPVF
ncbi:UNVERIFIED_CONTAM: hypothetical protein HDU68_006040 [Siphonaria sp. JEL0065]|nr:hypothetical protein HDU68_006040 [Siphonaria sp. JEL0065]